uniref:Uncharacterized protein n=1 Tax=Pipistrellus kuhlii TaxID=59472 RepID=A0A7J7X140_PIPKU|nr:hypothetical protein mPipKuh1_010807 [Pipistrellus kuhlii]
MGFQGGACSFGFCQPRPMRVLQCSLLAPLRERCPRFLPAAKQSMLSPNEPGIGVQFSWKWSWRWHSEQTGAQSPSRQGNPAAQPTVPSLRAVCTPPGPPFAAPLGFALQPGSLWLSLSPRGLA